MQKNNIFKIFARKINIDPVLIYSVIVMMSIMYHYKSSYTLVYGLASFVIGALLFRFFDYMTKHKFIGSLGYVAIFSVVMCMVKFFVNKGSESYPLSFGVWFLTPQDLLDYCKWYTVAIFLLFMIFMMSVIYYFTRVRYRIFMGFLIFIIPFAIYGKEYEKMPIVFIILLTASYVLIMIRFRQMQNTNEIELVDKKSIYMSLAFYTILFVSFSAIVPKPEIEADRDLLDTLISAEQFTDKLTAMLGIFQDTTDGGQFRSNVNSPVYYVNSKEPMRLKLTTFSTYNYNNDSWSVEYLDKNFVDTFEKDDDSIQNGIYNFEETASLTKALISVSENNQDFAEKYGLSGLSSSQITVPEDRWVSIFSNSSGSQFAPVPTLVQSFWSTSYSQEMALIHSNIIYANGNPNRFSYNEKFVFSYTPDTFFMNSDNKTVIDALSVNEYEQMLKDAIELSEGDASELISSELQKYISYDILLDYGDNQKIYNLSKKITDGLTSDYEKALAIESYFSNNDYIYDSDYQKTSTENAESFIFTSKRGVCYEYATAMVLIARASGIPARYCEGYNMSQVYENRTTNTNFVVTGNDAHGFPELYIKGFGWVSFEPTVAVDEEILYNTTSESLTIIGIAIFIMTIFVILGMIFYPNVSHKLFVLKYSKKNPNESVEAIINRIFKMTGMNNVCTSHELAEFVLSEWGIDIYIVAELFDKAVYGECLLNDNDKETAMSVYISVYENFREKKKIRTRN